jgi:hypothetical protein
LSEYFLFYTLRHGNLQKAVSLSIIPPPSVASENF